MQRSRKNKVPFSAYITEECKKLVVYLSEREDLTEVAFIKKAIDNFLEGDDHVIDGRILITKRNAKGYIRRNALISGYIDVEQKMQLEDIAKKQGANFSQVFFQCLIYYCALLISMDDRGIIITNKYK